MKLPAIFKISFEHGTVCMKYPFAAKSWLRIFLYLLKSTLEFYKEFRYKKREVLIKNTAGLKISIVGCMATLRKMFV